VQLRRRSSAFLKLSEEAREKLEQEVALQELKEVA
jgi:hypothetical protein